ncbi:ankyrin repeat-containing domain protein [Trichoderma austrokoningii]
MRLLRTDTIEIQTFEYGDIPPYAILSHRWGKDEITYQDLEAGTKTIERKAGFQKLRQCCAKAKADGFDHVWIDTCCIDKTSSAELSEAINSMFNWYQQAERCYAHLADVPSKLTFQESEWFTRGWTLQELLAPSDIHFVDDTWQCIGTKTTRQQDISDCTGIPVNILCGDDDLDTASVAQRMSWASKRKTQRLEDRAYCLMGIFGIYMPLIYGEGEQAFLRLQEEIMKISHDDSLFAWKSSDSRGGLLATSPEAFEDSGDIIQFNLFNDHNAAFTINSRGIHLKAHFMGIGPQRLGLAILHCKRKSEDKSVAIYARDLSGTMETFERVMSEKLEYFDRSRFRPSQYPMRTMCIQSGRTRPLLKSNNSRKQKRDDSTQYNTYDNYTLQSSMQFDSVDAVSRAARSLLPDDMWLLLTRDDVEINWRDDDGWTPLHHAVSTGDKATVEMLLARGADINCVNTAGESPICLAAEEGHEDIFKLLIDAKALINPAEPEHMMPLSSAIKSGHMNIVKLLLENGAKIGQKDGSIGIGKTPLSLAASNTDQSILRLILEHRAQVLANDSMITRSPILSAIMEGNTDYIRSCIKKRLRYSQIASDLYNVTPLSLAILHGRGDIAKLLLGNGTQADETYCGLSALSLAISRGHDDIVELLLKKGAKADVADSSGKTPLSLAVLNGRQDYIELLLKYGAKADGKGEHGETPLLLAVCRKEEDIVTLLLESGPEVDVQDVSGSTPLKMAAESGQEGIASLLLAAGAKVNVQDIIRKTPLMMAAACGNGSIVSLLLKRGAHVNTKDYIGQTALSLAVRSGHEHIVKLLLQDGADVGLGDSGGVTPLMLAKSSEQEGIIKLLQAKEKTMASRRVWS